MRVAHAQGGAARRVVGAMKVSPFGRRTRGGGPAGEPRPSGRGRRRRSVGVVVRAPPCTIRVGGVERGLLRAGGACGLGRGARRDPPAGAGLQQTGSWRRGLGFLRGAETPGGSDRAVSSRDSCLSRRPARSCYRRVSRLLWAVPRRRAVTLALAAEGVRGALPPRATAERLGQKESFLLKPLVGCLFMRYGAGGAQRAGACLHPHDDFLYCWLIIDFIKFFFRNQA